MTGLDKEKLKEAVNRFHAVKIMVIGDVMMDEFIWGKVSRISPEAPIPVVDVRDESRMLGGAGNVVHNICSLGAQASLCAVVGRDEMGRRVVRELRKLGCTTEGIVVDESRPTTVKTRIVAHGQQVVRFDRENREKISEESIGKILYCVRDNLADTSAVIISDYAKGVICPKLMDGLRALLSKNKVIWAVDPKVRDVRLFKGVTIFTPNQLEAESITGIRIDSDESLGRAGEKLKKLVQCKAALVTRGEAGMALIEKGQGVYLIPTVAKEVYDVTGAGDTVIAVMTLGLAAGLTPREAATLANFAAGIVVGKIGTATVRAVELINAITDL
ncbi:MAG: D-glycero-beta-D-manno-heptose-7-phosphate kinase [Thermodesulfobacteriota bacterium]